jgi:hypothetical protein
MKKTMIFGLVAFAAIALFASSAAAGPDGGRGASGVTDPALLALITDDNVFATMNLSTLLDPPAGAGTPTRHYGPYPAESPDSGTCGPDWANDTFDRHFTVRQDVDGTFTVVEQFKNGSFTTMAGPSPGSCDTSDGSPPGTVDGGKTGNMLGYFIIPLPPGETYSTNPSCNAFTSSNDNCTTTTFIDSHFSPACYLGGTGTCPVTTYFFHFSAGDQSLVEHEWKNASTDRGGNHGDIRSTNT